MSRLNRSLFALFSVLIVPIYANAQVETLETLETTPRPEQRSGPSALGPITAIRPAALWMATLDTDQDYRITRDEFQSGLDVTFAKYDSNGDNRLTLFDIEDWRKAALGSVDAAPHSLQFDNDYNSSITRAEFDATLIAMFSGSDKNDDKAVSFDELVTIVERPQWHSAPREDKPERAQHQQRRR